MPFPNPTPLPTDPYAKGQDIAYPSETHDLTKARKHLFQEIPFYSLTRPSFSGAILQPPPYPGLAGRRQLPAHDNVRPGLLPVALGAFLVCHAWAAGLPLVWVAGGTGCPDGAGVCGDGVCRAAPWGLGTAITRRSSLRHASARCVNFSPGEDVMVWLLCSECVRGAQRGQDQDIGYKCVEMHSCCCGSLLFVPSGYELCI